MALRQPSWFQSAQHPAENDRNLTGGIVAAGGVPGPYDLVPGLSSAGGMRVSVGPGSVFLRGAETWQGVYHCINDDYYDVTVAGANATLPRLDYVVARVRDPDYGATTGQTPWTLVALTGTAAAVPSVPTSSLLPGDEVIAQVRVDPGVTAIAVGKVTSLRRLARFRAIGSVAGQADRDALTPYNGLVLYRDDLNRFESFANGWCVPVVQRPDGSVAITGSVTVAASGAARLTADILTVTGDAAIAGTLTVGAVSAGNVVTDNVVASGNVTATTGTFIDRTGRDVINALGIGGLQSDPYSMDTPPYQRAPGLYISNSQLAGGFGTYLTATIGGSVAWQCWVNYGVGNSNDINWSAVLIRTWNPAGDGTWGQWRRLASLPLNGGPDHAFAG